MMILFLSLLTYFKWYNYYFWAVPGGFTDYLDILWLLVVNVIISSFNVIDCLFLFPFALDFITLLFSIMFTCVDPKTSSCYFSSS